MAAMVTALPSAPSSPSRFVFGVKAWPRIHNRPPRLRPVRRFRVASWIEEVQEGCQQVSSSLDGLPTFMRTLRRSPAARQFLSAVIIAALLAWSWAPVGSLLYLAMKPEDWWQGAELSAGSFQHMDECRLKWAEAKQRMCYPFLWASFHGMRVLRFQRCKHWRQRYLETFWPALCSQRFLILRQQFHSFTLGDFCVMILDVVTLRKKESSADKLLALKTRVLGPSSMLHKDLQRRTCLDAEGLRLALLLRLLSVGWVDALLCLAMGSLGVSPQQFALGHLIACWRSSIEYACLGATLVDHGGAQAEVLILLQLLLVIASGAVVTTCAAKISDQLLNRTAARYASSWPSVEAVEVQRSLPQVALEALEEPPRDPCLIRGYEVPFPLASLDDLQSPRYPCPHHPVLMMYSPSGVFSSYPVDREVIQHGDGLRFADGSEERPAHVHRMEMFQDAVAHMKEEHPCDIQFSLGQTPTKYFRQGFPESQRNETLQKIGLKPTDFSDFSTYCSDRHSLTNFHFDQHPGCLQMCSGRKQVLLVHPRFSNYMRSFVEERRSWITSEIQAVTVPHWNIILNPGDCLFIPAGFWHQVKSLDSPTLGTVLRYK
eukprot:s1385_g51.t1